MGKLNREMHIESKYKHIVAKNDELMQQNIELQQQLSAQVAVIQKQQHMITHSPSMAASPLSTVTPCHFPFNSNAIKRLSTDSQMSGVSNYQQFATPTTT